MPRSLSLLSKLTVLSLMLGAVSCTQPESTQSSTDGSAQPQAETSAEGGAQVVASYSVLCDIAEQIAQDTVDVACLIDASQDPHAYSATPADRRAIEEAALVLYGGYNFEPGIIAMIEATDSPAPKVAVSEVAVTAPLMGEAHDHGAHGHGEEHSKEEHHDHDGEAHSEEVHHDHGHEHGEEHSEEKHSEEEHHDHAHAEDEAHAEGEEHHDHSEHDHGEAHADEELAPDPHVWHDAENGVAMVETVQTQLSEAFPENAELYEANAAALIAQLEQLDTWIQTQIETIPADSRTLISTHDALGYYADAYGIELEPVLGSFSTEARPSAADVKALTEVVEAKSVPSIFVESTSNPGLIETVSRETDIAVSEDPIYADGLGEPGTPAESYQGMLVTNTCNIVNGLGGTCDQAAGQALLVAE
ncbi:MAG: zinc ABC transporter substrate-binding protein [Cyanobacteria bacterium J06632_3]